jgi:hypothetical protein
VLRTKGFKSAYNSSRACRFPSTASQWYRWDGPMLSPGWMRCIPKFPTTSTSVLSTSLQG